MVAALATRVLVFDRAAVSPSTVDGEEMPEGRRFSDRAACEVGNYLIEAKRNDAWDATSGWCCASTPNIPITFSV